MYHCERSKSRNPCPMESNIHSLRCFSVLSKLECSSLKRLPRSETPTDDYSSVFIDYNSFDVACFAIEIKETNQ